MVNGDGKAVLGESQNERSTDPSGTSSHQRRFGNRQERQRPGELIGPFGLTGGHVAPSAAAEPASWHEPRRVQKRRRVRPSIDRAARRSLASQQLACG